MKLDDFLKWVDKNCIYGLDYVVKILLKYDHEKQFRKVTSILFMEDESTYSWNYDWYEGEQDVIVLACVPVHLVSIKAMDFISN